MPRPDDSVDWAPNAEADDVSEPTAERDRGYQDGEDLPNEQINWLLRALGDWVQYFDDQFQGTTGLIDFFSGLDFGDNGDWQKNTDDGTDYEAQATHTGGGTATLVTDIFRATAAHVSDALRGDTSDTIDVESQAGTSGDGGLSLGYLQGTTADAGAQGYELVDFQKSDGSPEEAGALLDALHASDSSLIEVISNTGTIGGGGFLLNELQAGSVSNQILFSDNSGSLGDGLAVARNVVRAHCIVSSTTTPIGRGSVGVSSINSVSTGVYEIGLSETTNNATAVATLNQSETESTLAGYSIAAALTDDSLVEVRIWDETNTLANAGFNLHVAYIEDG